MRRLVLIEKEFLSHFILSLENSRRAEFNFIQFFFTVIPLTNFLKKTKNLKLGSVTDGGKKSIVSEDFTTMVS